MIGDTQFARNWRNPVRTRVTPLDSNDALYIVYLAYTGKPIDNAVRFQHPCVRPVRFTYVPNISLTRALSAPVRQTCALYAHT